MNAVDQAEESIERVFAALRSESGESDTEIYRVIAIATREILDAVLAGESLYCIAHRHQCCPECVKAESQADGYAERSSGGCAE